MSGNKTEDNIPENTKDCREISKKNASDPKSTLENVGPSEKHTEEKINENETSTGDECEAESEIDSIVENGQKKPGSENGSSEENICDDLDSNSGHKNSIEESPSKERDNINESSISKETINITITTEQDTETSSAEENDNEPNENKNDVINRREIAEERENKQNENKNDVINRREIAEERENKQSENKNDGINLRGLAEERENKQNEKKDLKNEINSREIAKERDNEQNENRDLNSRTHVAGTPGAPEVLPGCSGEELCYMGINSRKIAAAGDDDQVKKTLKKFGLFALKTAVISGAILGGTAIIVPAIGFGSLGVTGGSLAAAYQSSVLGGTIASGSAFATLQSIGMAGLSAATNGAVVAGSAVASAAHTFRKSKDK